MNVIIHIDLDCFYAQCVVQAEPALRGKPVAVRQKNLFVTANYAARLLASSQGHDLKKCNNQHHARDICGPSLQVRSGEDTWPFQQAHFRIKALLEGEFGPVEKTGIDEFALDATQLAQVQGARSCAEELAGYVIRTAGTGAGAGTAGAGCIDLRLGGPAAVLDASSEGWVPQGQALAGTVPQSVSDVNAEAEAQAEEAEVLDFSQLDSLYLAGMAVGLRIQQRLRLVLGFSCSVGVAPSKLLAKLAAGRHKPSGLSVLLPGEVEAFTAALPWGQLPLLRGSGRLAPLVERAIRRRQRQGQGQGHMNGDGGNYWLSCAALQLLSAEEVCACTDTQESQRQSPGQGQAQGHNQTETGTENEIGAVAGSGGGAALLTDAHTALGFARGLDHRPLQPSGLPQSVGIEETYASSSRSAAPQVLRTFEEVERELFRSPKLFPGLAVRLRWHLAHHGRRYEKLRVSVRCLGTKYSARVSAPPVPMPAAVYRGCRVGGHGAGSQTQEEAGEAGKTEAEVEAEAVMGGLRSKLQTLSAGAGLDVCAITVEAFAPLDVPQGGGLHAWLQPMPEQRLGQMQTQTPKQTQSKKRGVAALWAGLGGVDVEAGTEAPSASKKHPPANAASKAAANTAHSTHARTPTACVDLDEEGQGWVCCACTYQHFPAQRRFLCCLVCGSSRSQGAVDATVKHRG
ncbi:hypothetical protein B484DRAFT_1548 [Ochromonadaceae sp. CCMP2298]|nr:hypothetical protein B484DRAFT_1548 [Ochromonadaceae sp. CCMP2298]